MFIRKIIPPLLLSSLFGACTLHEADDPLENENAGAVSSPIINGTAPPTADALADITVKLTSVNGSLCSGTLVNNRWVLTAGHCVSSVKAYYGNPSPVWTATTRTGAHADVDWVITNPDYGGTVGNVPSGVDAALFHLSSPLGGTFRTSLRTSPLAVGSVLNCYGWGDDHIVFGSSGSLDGTGRGTLRTGAIQVKAVAASTYQVKAVSAASGQIQWLGDSGGGCFDSNGSLTGIQSTANTSIGIGGPQIDFTTQTAMSYIHQWVNETVTGETTELSSTTNEMTLLRLDFAGHISFRDYRNNAWGPAAKIGSIGNVFPPQKIAAVSRNPNHQDVFLRGYDGRIYTTWREFYGPWSTLAPVINDTNVFDGDVAAVAKPDNVTIAVMKKDGTCYEAHWDANNAAERWPQRGWMLIAGGLEPPKGGNGIRVALAQPTASTVRLYAVDSATHRLVTLPRTNYVFGAWATLGTSSDQFASQSLAALSRGSTTSVFGFSTTGMIRGSDAVTNGGAFYNISSAFTSPQTLTAVARNTAHVDLFLRGDDHRVYNLWSENGGGWAQVGPLGVPSNILPEGNLSSVAMNANHVAFYGVGYDDQTWTSSWDSTNGWIGWSFFPAP